jgi:hypothetical protein
LPTRVVRRPNVGDCGPYVQRKGAIHAWNAYVNPNARLEQNVATDVLCASILLEPVERLGGCVELKVARLNRVPCSMPDASFLNEPILKQWNEPKLKPKSFRGLGSNMGQKIFSKGGVCIWHAVGGVFSLGLIDVLLQSGHLLEPRPSCSCFSQAIEVLLASWTESKNAVERLSTLVLGLVGGAKRCAIMFLCGRIISHSRQHRRISCRCA